MNPLHFGAKLIAFQQNGHPVSTLVANSAADTINNMSGGYACLYPSWCKGEELPMHYLLLSPTEKDTFSGLIAKDPDRAESLKAEYEAQAGPAEIVEIKVKIMTDLNTLLDPHR